MDRLTDFHRQRRPTSASHPTTKGMHKLSALWEGPFIVMEVISPSTYHLQWADGQGVPKSGTLST
jgi:hypothetical protein